MEEEVEVEVMRVNVWFGEEAEEVKVEVEVVVEEEVLEEEAVVVSGD